MDLAIQLGSVDWILTEETKQDSKGCKSESMPTHSKIAEQKVATMVELGKVLKILRDDNMNLYTESILLKSKIGKHNENCLEEARTKRSTN